METPVRQASPLKSTDLINVSLHRNRFALPAIQLFEIPQDRSNINILLQDKMHPMNVKVRTWALHIHILDSGDFELD